MVTQAFVDEVVRFARKQAEQYNVPPFPQTEFIHQKSQLIAASKGADAKVVSVGVFLMDVMLGKAIAEGKRETHVQQALENAQSMLEKHSGISTSEKENILACIREHHGTPTFYSVESEICCNADCYRFASVQGMLLGIHHGRKMPIEQLIKLYREKVAEKWHALSFPECREELQEQHNAICTFLDAF